LEQDKTTANANIRRRRRIRRKKPKARFHGGNFVSVCLVLYALFLMGNAVYTHLNKQTIATVEIKNDVIDTQKGSINGVIIRREEVLYSNGAGAVDFFVNDKERVKKGAALLQIKDAGHAKDIEKNIADINETLNDYQTRRSDLSSSYSDAQRINAQIKEALEKGLHKFIGTDMSEVYDLKNTIAQNVDMRNQALLSENKDTLKGYMDDKSFYESELVKYVKTVSSPYSGVVSYHLDNMEDFFSFNAIEALTEEQVLMKPSNITYSANKTVEANSPVCKVITGNDWYIAGYADNEYTAGLEVGDAKRLYIHKDDETITIEMTVFYMRAGASKTYIVFKSTKNIIDYMDIRNITFKLTDTAYKGLKIPNSAIVGRTFVKAPEYIVKDGGVLKKTDTGSVRIEVYTNRSKAPPGYVYILFDFSKFAPGDFLLPQAEGEDTAAYKIIEDDFLSLNGVYKANNQTASFVCIDDEDVVSAGGYTLLDPDKNPSLNPYDKIVADGSKIYDGQILN